jgi:hypothetical protein
MISVVLYGRNDSHGYNLHKRAAISLNCIAELLTHPEDEIIFVDCNTPDDLPTFVEAIGDTLTPKLKSLLRILRIRPSLYDKFKGESPLKALEPHCRNVAIRGSNPANKWILSTNTDMIFVVRDPEQSLSDAVTDLPDGFYELPRFEIPDSMWERFDRLNPSQIISNMRRWGQSLHLNEAVSGHHIIRFDGPGDFQLMLRDQIFAIHGFDERMIWGWHADSNICKRMYLLNGKTDSFLDRCFGYHCSHVRTVTWYHRDNTTQNSMDKFFRQVRNPHLPNQKGWGLVNEELEELRLSNETGARFCQVLEDILPGTTELFTSAAYTQESFNSGFYYDNEHVLPFLVDYLSTVHPKTVIGYFGSNIKMLTLLNEFLGKWTFAGSVLICEDLFPPGEASISSFSESFKSIDGEDCIQQAELFIFDFNMARFPKAPGLSGLSYPQVSTETEDWTKCLLDWFVTAVKVEHARAFNQQRRKFLMAGWRHSSFEQLYNNSLETVFTPYSSHVVYGYVRKILDIENLEVIKRQATLITRPDKEILDFISHHLDPSEPLLAADQFMWLMPERHHRYWEHINWEKNFRLAVLYKGDVLSITREVLSKIDCTMKPVFANECYVCFSSIPDMEPIRTPHPHFPIDENAREVLDFVTKHSNPDEPILAADQLVWGILNRHHSYWPDVDWEKNYRWVILYKDDVFSITREVLSKIDCTMKPVFANECYVCFSSIPDMEPIRTPHPHFPIDSVALDTHSFISSHINANEPILVSYSFVWRSLAHHLHTFPCRGDIDQQKDYKFAVIDKLDFYQMKWSTLLYIAQTMRPIMTDKHFVYFSKTTGVRSPRSITASLYFGLWFTKAFLRKGVNYIYRKWRRSGAARLIFPDASNYSNRP